MSRARRDEEGVSTVLGAILMFGLFVMTLILVQTQYVPVWDKQREQDFSLHVSQQVAALNGDLHRLASNQTSAAIADPLSLQREQGFSFFGSRPLPGVATFTPISVGAGVTVSTANTFKVQAQGGSTLYSLSEDWSWSGAAITGVTGLEHLRLRIPAPGGLPLSPTPLSFVVQDGSGNCLAQLKLAAPGALLAKTIEAQMYGPQAPPAGTCAATPYDIQDTYIGAAAPAYYYLDGLDSSFAQALDAIPASRYPLTLSFTPGNTAGQVSVVYRQQTQFGEVVVGGSGQSFTSYNQAIPTGTLTVDMHNLRMPAQTFVLEYGAEFLDQPDGSAMVVPPAFSVSTAAAQGSIAWSIPAMGGGSAGVTGARSATVAAAPTAARETIQATARDITFTITTEHATAWQQYWDRQFRLAGLSSTAVTPQAPCSVLTASPQYATATTATSASVTFFGPCSHPTDTTQDVALTLQYATLAIDLRPGG